MGFKREELQEVKITPKSKNQAAYLDAIDANYITFGIGPAGSGKTFLAVLKAMEGYQKRKYTSIILVRPAKEAGEELGYLPGDKEQKMDPFMMPLYDSMHEFWSQMAIEEMVVQRDIEIAPIAYMRGRTFRNAFILVDEAQNLTVEQLKMVMTRFGPDSKMVINGDHTQSDLHPFKQGALKRAQALVEHGITGIDMVHLNHKDDIQRHPVVGDIIEVFDKLDEQEKEEDANERTRSKPD